MVVVESNGTVGGAVGCRVENVGARVGAAVIGETVVAPGVGAVVDKVGDVVGAGVVAPCVGGVEVGSGVTISEGGGAVGGVIVGRNVGAGEVTCENKFEACAPHPHAVLTVLCI